MIIKAEEVPNNNLLKIKNKLSLKVKIPQVIKNETSFSDNKNEIMKNILSNINNNQTQKSSKCRNNLI